MNRRLSHRSVDRQSERWLKLGMPARSVVLAAALVAFAVSACRAEETLVKVGDVPLPGRASRFDYQSFDPGTGMLYFTHMGDGELVAFDTGNRQVVAHLPGFPTATGVLVVPELHRVFVSVAGRHEVAVLDATTLKVLARVPAGDFPDGLAYAPDVHKVFVSDESGGMEPVIDTETNKRVDTIDMGGAVGNTRYDPASHRILANVQDRNQLVVIDPRTDAIVGRHVLRGGEGPHGLLILKPGELAVAACEDDARLLVIDLHTFQVTQVLTTGDVPDVLAFDAGLGRLYAGTESNVVSIFQLSDGELRKIQDLAVAPRAHSVAVNPRNHEVYLPLQNVGGRPVLRIMKPAIH